MEEIILWSRGIISLELPVFAFLLSGSVSGACVSREAAGGARGEGAS